MGKYQKTLSQFFSLNAFFSSEGNDVIEPNHRAFRRITSVNTHFLNRLPQKYPPSKTTDILSRRAYRIVFLAPPDWPL